jgi:hypothetical protein
VTKVDTIEVADRDAVQGQQGYRMGTRDPRVNVR